MGELDPFDVPDALLGQSFDISEAIVSLRRLGAEKFDPLRLHYLQVLAHRAKAYRGPVKTFWMLSWYRRLGRSENASRRRKVMQKKILAILQSSFHTPGPTCSICLKVAISAL